MWGKNAMPYASSMAFHRHFPSTTHLSYRARINEKQAAVLFSERGTDCNKNLHARMSEAKAMQSRRLAVMHVRSPAVSFKLNSSRASCACAHGDNHCPPCKTAHARQRNETAWPPSRIRDALSLTRVATLRMKLQPGTCPSQYYPDRMLG